MSIKNQVEVRLQSRMDEAIEFGDESRSEVLYELDGIIDEVLTAYFHVVGWEIGGHLRGTPLFVQALCDHIRRTIDGYQDLPDYQGRKMMLSSVRRLSSLLSEPE